MQSTINSIVFEEDVIELVETSEKEKSEKELNEELEFINSHSIYKLLSQAILLGYNSYFNISDYSSPVKSILTPPPNFQG